MVSGVMLRRQGCPALFGSRLGLRGLRDAVWLREVSTCQSYLDGLGLLDIMDDCLPRRGSIPSTNGINDGSVEGFQACLLATRSCRTSDVMGEPACSFV